MSAEDIRYFFTKYWWQNAFGVIFVSVRYINLHFFTYLLTHLFAAGTMDGG